MDNKERAEKGLEEEIKSITDELLNDELAESTLTKEIIEPEPIIENIQGEILETTEEIEATDASTEDTSEVTTEAEGASAGAEAEIINYGTAPKQKKGSLSKPFLIGLGVVIVTGAVVVAVVLGLFKNKKSPATMKVKDYEVASISGFLEKEMTTTNIEVGSDMETNYLWHEYDGASFDAVELEEYMKSLVDDGFDGFITDSEEGYYVYQFFKFIDGEVLEVRIMDEGPSRYAIGLITYEYKEEEFEWIKELIEGEEEPMEESSAPSKVG